MVIPKEDVIFNQTQAQANVQLRWIIVYFQSLVGLRLRLWFIL